MFGLWNLPTGADELAGVLDLARRPEEPSRSPSPPRRIVAGSWLLLSRRGVALKEPGKSRSSRTRGQEIPRIAVATSPDCRRLVASPFPSRRRPEGARQEQIVADSRPGNPANRRRHLQLSRLVVFSASPVLLVLDREL